MNNLNKLWKLCGLSPDELADVGENNPRAYMAVKGAVAEKHLHKYFNSLLKNGSISSFRMAENDFEKDFYVKLVDGTERVIECKNVEVLKISSKPSLIGYLKFLRSELGLIEQIKESELLDMKLKDLKVILSSLPQRFRESGMARYDFSASRLKFHSVYDLNSDLEFLEQFEDSPLSIDFQRTRNQKGATENIESKAGRFYKEREIDIVGACLFSRTKRWEFVFGSCNHFERHPKYPSHYSNRLVIEKSRWSKDFLSVV